LLFLPPAPEANCPPHPKRIGFIRRAEIIPLLEYLILKRFQGVWSTV
jgi:hypothetical protein